MPKAVDPEEKRAELVEASWQVIADEGLRAATLRRVAAEAGCSTGQLTHYFSGRRALLIDALRSAHYRAGARMADAATRAPGDLARLEAVLLEALPLDQTRLREWRLWLAFWAESMNDTDLAVENARRYAEWRELLIARVRPLVRTRQQADHEVDQLIALVDGLGLRAARSSEPDAGVEAQRRECRATLRRHLNRFK